MELSELKVIIQNNDFDLLEFQKDKIVSLIEIVEHAESLKICENCSYSYDDECRGLVCDYLGGESVNEDFYCKGFSK